MPSSESFIHLFLTGACILDWGLVPALQSLIDIYPVRTSIPVEAKFDDDFVRYERANSDQIPEPLKLAAYRIAEEALEMMSTIPQARKVALGLQLLSGGWLRLVVRANGQGLDIEDSDSRLGMASMRDYAEASGGECVVTTTPGVGTEVVATLPLAGRGQEQPENGAA